MNTTTFSPCDLKSDSETVYVPMFKEQGAWYRDCLYTTLEEAQARNNERIAILTQHSLPIPEMRIVRGHYELLG